MASRNNARRGSGGGGFLLIVVCGVIGAIILGKMSLPGLPNPYSNDICPIESPPWTVRLAIFLAFPEPWLYPQAEATSLSESHYSPDAIAENDYGIMQVNIYWQAGLLAEMGLTPEDLFDPFTNARVARQVFERNGNSFNPWYGPKRCGFNLRNTN